MFFDDINDSSVYICSVVFIRRQILYLEDEFDEAFKPEKKLTFCFKSRAVNFRKKIRINNLPWVRELKLFSTYFWDKRKN